VPFASKPNEYCPFTSVVVDAAAAPVRLTVAPAAPVTVPETLNVAGLSPPPPLREQPARTRSPTDAASAMRAFTVNMKSPPCACARPAPGAARTASPAPAQCIRYR